MPDMLKNPFIDNNLENFIKEIN